MRTETRKAGGRGRTFLRLSLRRSPGFTFFEILITVVILSVGIVGIYRAFLLSLNYQRYLLTRLYVMNFLTDELAKAESLWLSRGRFPSDSLGEISFPVDTRSKFSAQRIAVSQSAAGNGLDQIGIKLLWKDGDAERMFERSTLVYYDQK